MTLPFRRWRELQRNATLKLTSADHEQADGFLHFCDEWDGLLIDRGDAEFQCCSCSFAYPDFDPFTGKRALGALPDPRKPPQ